MAFNPYGSNTDPLQELAKVPSSHPGKIKIFGLAFSISADIGFGMKKREPA
jgi:hypothetical protein